MNPREESCRLNEVLKQNMKRVKLNPGTRRTYIPHFQEMIAKANTVGDIVKALKKAGSTYGIHSDMPPELYKKLELAMNCKVQIKDIPAVG